MATKKKSAPKRQKVKKPVEMKDIKEFHGTIEYDPESKTGFVKPTPEKKTVKKKAAPKKAAEKVTEKPDPVLEHLRSECPRGSVHCTPRPVRLNTGTVLCRSCEHRYSI